MHVYRIIKNMISIVILLGISFDPLSGLAEISVDSYCQLTIQSLKQQLPITQEIISIVKQYQNDPSTMEDQLRLKRAELEDARLALYDSFGTTADEYVAYMSSNSRAVEAYLDANPEIRQQIEDLSAQLKELMVQEDELMAAKKDTPLPE